MEAESLERLKTVLTACRGLLERSLRARLERQYGFDLEKEWVNDVGLSHPTSEEDRLRLELVTGYEYLRSAGFGQRVAALRIVRELALTHLIRLIALRMLEVRGLIPTAIGSGTQSELFVQWLGERAAGRAPIGGYDMGRWYEGYLAELMAGLAPDIRPLFDPADPASRLFPEPNVLEQVLCRLNDPAFAPVFARNRTLAWCYQFLKGGEEGKTAHNRGGVPGHRGTPFRPDRFNPPRYRVECLVDNTIGRLWYEMRGGETALANACQRMVKGPDEVFLGDSWISPEVRVYLAGEVEERPDLYALAHAHRPFEWAGTRGAADRKKLLKDLATGRRRAEDLVPLPTRYLWETLFSVARAHRFNEAWDDWEAELEMIGEEIHRRLAACRAGTRAGPTLVPFRPMVDPREIRVLDPACGSGRLLIYAFDLLFIIYREAYAGSKAAWLDNRSLRDAYPDRATFERALPGLILAHNLHGIDTDCRAVQIASFGLWLRAQRAYDELGVPNADRPSIPRIHVVVAEPMLKEDHLFNEFEAALEPPLLRTLVRGVNLAMQLPRGAESWPRVEGSLRRVVETARCEWIMLPQKERLAFLRPGGDRGWTLDRHEVTLEAFFAAAKRRVLDALDTFVTQGENEARRRRFAQDVVRMFEFVEVVLKDYDVVFTVPPSGAPLEGAVETCLR